MQCKTAKKYSDMNNTVNIKINTNDKIEKNGKN